MKSSGQQPESSKKRQAGEYLKTADKLLKQSEFDAALVEVERCLELDPGNFYAHAYKERIISLRAKHAQQPHPPAAAAPAPPPAASAPPHPAQESAPAPAPRQEGKPGEHSAPAKPSEQPHVPLTQEEARKKFLDEKRRAEEELRKQAEEARRRAEEELRRRAQELEAMHTTESLERRKAQEEEKRRREEEQRRRPADDERARLETENRRRSEDIERKKLEEDLQARNAGQQRAAEEAEAIRSAEADAKARAKEQKLHDYLLEAKDLVAKRSFPEALTPLLKITTLEPGHAEAQQMLSGLRQIEEQSWEPNVKAAEALPREAALAVYRKALSIAYREGTPDSAASGILAELKKTLSVTDAEHVSIDPQAKRDALATALAAHTAAGGAENDSFTARLQRELGAG
jgi:hypothetical protein